jgi:hypothetical protein
MYDYAEDGHIQPPHLFRIKNGAGKCHLPGRSHMDALVLLGGLAIIIGVIGVIVLLKGRKKRPQ